VFPEPKTIVFANNALQPVESEWVDVSGGYNTLSVALDITEQISQYDIQFSNNVDNSNFTTQMTVKCNNQNKCPLVTIPILAKYYRISSGTASGHITSFGYLVRD
jgi:hypothetical protein